MLATFLPGGIGQTGEKLFERLLGMVRFRLGGVRIVFGIEFGVEVIKGDFAAAPLLNVPCQYPAWPDLVIGNVGDI